MRITEDNLEEVQKRKVKMKDNKCVNHSRSFNNDKDANEFAKKVKGESFCYNATYVVNWKTRSGKEDEYEEYICKN